MNIARRLFLLPFIAVLVLATGAAPASAQTEPTGVTTNANWIMSSVLPSGAIQIYPGNAPHDVEPYFANYAAMGLSRAALLTGNTSYANAAWNWLAWYSAHEGPNGFVTDYTVSATGAETSTGTYDSTDSYAGTFLSAVGMAYPTAPARAASVAAGIHGAINAILATQDTDGLTWATPTYHVKYLMDNGEVYDGLVAAARVETSLGDTHWASVASSAASAMLSSIHNMWNAGANDYNWAKFPGGGMQTTNWKVLYPDALEQASAAAFHVAANHSNSLMATFGTDQPSITNPAAVGYQPFAVIGLEAAGASTAGVNQALAIESYADSTNHAWPFNVAVAGQLVFGESDSALVGA
jgi:hypothetical protein